MVEWLNGQRQCGGGSGGKVAAGVVPAGDAGGDGVPQSTVGKLAARALCAIYPSRAEFEWSWGVRWAERRRSPIS